MSATTNFAGRGDVARRSKGPWPIHRLVVGAVVLIDFVILAVGIGLAGEDLLRQAWDISLWTVAVAIVGLAAVQLTGGAQLGLDLPLLLAAGYVLGPIPAGIIAFAGYIDLREFRGQIPLHRALFNRAQTSLSVLAATTVFSLAAGHEATWPIAMLAALAAVTTDAILNVALVAGVIALYERSAPRITLARLRLGSLTEFIATYASFGLLSLLLAEVYEGVGSWSLLTFILPLVLARRAFVQAQILEHANRKLQDQRNALEQATASIADERRDERLAIAAGLHDDVLPPLYKVHLMGQVVRQQLATGQLLAMENDVPELVRATDEASQTIRLLIRDLRESPLGAGGLARTLQLLVDQLESEITPVISADLEEVAGSPVVELLTYQVAREALRNALRHSAAARVSVLLRQDDDFIRLVVQDDGRGFSPEAVDTGSHFGLALMRERVELGGGELKVDSTLGRGTCVVARLPAGTSRQAHRLRD